MRKSLKLLLSAAVLAAGASITLAGSAAPAEARTSLFLSFGLPPLFFVPPPRYYYPPAPPPAYYAPPPGYYAPPPAYNAPPPGYYAAPPCRARYDWRWDGYQWRQAYVGCW